MLMDFLYIVIYSAVGLVLMMLGSFLVDLAIPCDFPEEIKKGNQAVAYIMTGSYVAIGIIIRNAVIDQVAVIGERGLASGMISTIVYSVVGIILCILGYLVMLLLNKKYNLNEEVGKGNTAAGIMIMGLFVGLGIIISGVIY